jgi:multidrug efflux pump subunit AcrB
VKIQDLALFRVRPYSLDPAGSIRTTTLWGQPARGRSSGVDPDKLRQYQLAPDEVIEAIAAGNTILPAGNIRTGRSRPDRADKFGLFRTSRNWQGYRSRCDRGATIYVRDIGVVENGSDILTGYGLFNEKRTVYIPVTKRADASTIDVVDRVRAELPDAGADTGRHPRQL